MNEIPSFCLPKLYYDLLEMPKPKFASQRRKKRKFYGNRFVNNNKEHREDLGNRSDGLED